jgi:GDP-mannose 6-dehydrogenase
MKISIFGLGYVGCVSAGCLAEMGHNVIGVDVNKEKVDLINSGMPTIIEKGIGDLIKTNVRNGNLKATNSAEYAVLNSELSIICVGTPNSEDGNLNLKYIFKVAGEIGNALRKKKSFHTILIRSTVKPGTNDKVGMIIKSKIINAENASEKFGVVSNPEFMREGSAIFDFLNPPYTLIASKSRKALKISRKLYSKINAGIIETDIKSAEIIKYINNTYHALKITFANEVGNICKSLGINSFEVMKLFCSDRKLNISEKYFNPGFAFGGSCLPKDLKALNSLAYEKRTEVPVISNIIKSNEIQIQNAFRMIEKTGRRKIGIIGLSFKAGTDDLRNSPSLELAEKLIGKGFSVKIYDKNLNTTKLFGVNKSVLEKKLPHIDNLLIKNIKEIILLSELLVFTTNEKEFLKINIPKNKFVVDLVNIKNLKNYIHYEAISW